MISLLRFFIFLVDLLNANSLHGLFKFEQFYEAIFEVQMSIFIFIEGSQIGAVLLKRPI